MPFSLDTMPTLVIYEVVHYSSINHCHHFQTQLNQLETSILILTTSTNIKYQQEIEFLMELQQFYIMVIGFINYLRFFYKIILEYMLKNNTQRFFYLFMHWKLKNSYVSLKFVTQKANNTYSVAHM